MIGKTHTDPAGPKRRHTHIHTHTHTHADQKEHTTEWRALCTRLDTLTKKGLTRTRTGTITRCLLRRRRTRVRCWGQARVRRFRVLPTRLWRMQRLSLQGLGWSTRPTRMRRHLGRGRSSRPPSRPPSRATSGPTPRRTGGSHASFPGTSGSPQTPERSSTQPHPPLREERSVRPRLCRVHTRRPLRRRGRFLLVKEEGWEWGGGRHGPGGGRE